MLPLLAQKLSDCFAPLSDVEVEIRELGVTVHVRRADPSPLAAIVAQAEQLRRTCAAEFRVWRSEVAVDLFPDVGCPLSFSARWILEQSACEGRVSRPSYTSAMTTPKRTPTGRFASRTMRYTWGSPTGMSAASYWVVDRSAAIDLLAQIAFAGVSVRRADDTGSFKSRACRYFARGAATADTAAMRKPWNKENGRRVWGKAA